MDEAKIDARASPAPSPTWPPSTALNDKAKLVAYLRASAAKGQGAVRLRRRSRLQGFGQQHRLRRQGGLGLPDRTTTPTPKTRTS
jgi:putative endopeptidase